MRRIALTAPGLGQMNWPLACDLAIVLAGADREVPRRYTVRSVTEDTLVVDAVLHGHGPGSTWAEQLSIGDQVSFFGPRGEVSIAEADWLLALTDESGLPAVAALAEAVTAAGRSLTVLAEIEDDAERYPVAGEVRWLVRNGAPAGHPELLLAALADFTPPPGAGFAYVIGESRAAVTLRDELARFGLDRSHVYAKGYWNLNSRPTR